VSYQRVGPRQAQGTPSGGTRRPVQRQSPFRKLARTHALNAIGDSAMYGALAGSVLFSLSPDAQRDKVLLYLLVSVAPFAVVAPAIGPAVDRFPGGRRILIQLTSLIRAAIYVVMAFHVDDLLLYPLVFGAMVMQKTYAVSKSAVVPSVVSNEEELVEANSKLGLISGLVGALAIGPLAGLGKWIGPAVPLFIGCGIFIMALFAANRLPRDVVASAPPQQQEREELRSAGLLLAAGGMALIRATIGFLTFHLFFWLREDYGLVQFGLAAGASTIGSMLGNTVAPALRRALREERMLMIALGVIAAAGISAAAVGGLATAVVLAFVVNFSSSVGRLAFDSIVQRDAPDANQGRAFARFETRFQLSWVLAGVPPVFFTLPGQVGFLVVGLFGLFAVVTYLIGAKAVRAGRPVPRTPLQKAKDGIQNGVAKRRGDTSSKGIRRPDHSGDIDRARAADRTRAIDGTRMIDRTRNQSRPTPRPRHEGR